MKNIGFEKINITDGFWKSQQDIAKNASIYSVYNRFEDTGRFEALKMNWKEGMPNRPHFFWDSDVAKWIESLAYILEKSPCDDLEAKADEMIDNIAANQSENGYINSYMAYFESDKIFTNRDRHELYTIGHLTEAAIAYHEHTGKRKLLDCMEKCLDLVYNVFVKYDAANFVTPGHEEIELALAKMYNYTGDKKYLEMANFFVDNRGLHRKSESANPAAPKYSQSHLPVREQTTAEGHAVRAVYLYTAMADLAYINNDKEMLKACETIFSNIVNKRMYITGGIGSTARGEAFTKDYDLPNIMAYTESCAAIGLIMFASRLQQISVNSIYGDVIEKALYNGFLSDKSLDGKAFFYENPIEIPPAASKVDDVRYPITQRLEVFGCSCCPPNITRLLASIGNYLYTTDENTVYCHQYMTSDAEIELGGKNIKITQKTDYPRDGKVSITCSGADTRLAVRVPGWCDSYKGQTQNGYLYLDVKDGETVNLEFEMVTRFMSANPRVNEDIGKAALTRGPIVFCLEEVDNGPLLRTFRFDVNTKFELGYDDKLNVITLTGDAKKQIVDLENESPLYYRTSECRFEDVKAKFIPYYAFANRGESEMAVFVNII
ncbi:MAG: glycoside hydrolase family 127 protein [Clostridia bacterium]|nr:glycoside hydrolase family 127 protein [Clostridia bacterium]